MVVVWFRVCVWCQFWETARKQTQHINESKRNRRTKNRYVMFVPQLTNDWHGMNESYGRWIKHVIECGLSHFFSLLNCLLSLCVCMWESVCVSVYVIMQRVALNRFAALPSWMFGALCMRMCIFYTACVLVRSFSLSLFPYGFIIYHAFILCLLFLSMPMCVRECACVSIRYCCSHSVCIAIEPSYAGVLLQGSACYFFFFILRSIRNTHVVVYGMRSVWLNWEREMDSTRPRGKHTEKTPLHHTTKQKEQMI